MTSHDTLIKGSAGLVALCALSLTLLALAPAARADHLPPGIQVIHIHNPPYLDRPAGAGPYSDSDIADAAELAKLGDAEAQANLGIMLASRGEYAKAANWYKLAANAGIATAAYNLGTLYFNGQGFQQDYAEAYKWFSQAARRKNAYAEFQLGIMYFTGQGVPRDPTKELSWYEKAARQGLAPAQYNLAVMYHNGDEIPADDVHAYAWMLLAKKSGFADAGGALDTIASGMTSAQISDAQKLSATLLDDPPVANH